MKKTYLLNHEQFLAVSQLGGSMRCKHFFSKVTDWENVWGLRNEDGWVAACDNEGNQGFPVWPHPDYASVCATGDWTGNSPYPIDVKDFVENWLLEFDKNGVMVFVFPTPEMQGVPMRALELQRELRIYLSQYD
jgi:Protein of unknown function (DUF2750)